MQYQYHCASQAYVLFDMHRPGAALDYPRGGLGSVIDSLVKGCTQGDHGSAVNLRRRVKSIDTSEDGLRFVGLTLTNGKKVVAKDGVICNAPVWSIIDLIPNATARKALNNMVAPNMNSAYRQSWNVPVNPRKRSTIQMDRSEPRIAREMDK